MHIVIRASENQKLELLQKGFGDNVSVNWVDHLTEASHADAYFDLLFNDADVHSNEFINDKPTFVHAVNALCTEINKSNYIRLNAWNGFLSRPVIELVCCDNDLKKIITEIFTQIGRSFVFVSDDYGLVSARIISMIINEAYYALEENVSTKEQIDIAMKLGTNYPYGPFEWSEKIGLQNVLALLQKLSNQNKRYTISGLLVNETQQFK